MKIEQLIFDKSIYPRGRHLGLDSEIKWNAENVENIRDELQKPNQGDITHKITYNKSTMHIIDGTHLWQAMRELGWKEIPEKFLREINIPIEDEMKYAVHYNAVHGLKLTNEEKKACLARYIDQKTGRMTYGKLKDLSELWHVNWDTLQTWAEQIKTGTYRQKDSVNLRNSTGNDGNEDLQNIQELEKKYAKLEAENTKIKDELKEVLMWKKAICPDHFQAISKCRLCGK